MDLVVYSEVPKVGVFIPSNIFPDVFTSRLLLILLDDLGAFHSLISRNLFINQTFFAAALVMTISHLRLHCLLAKS